MSFLSPGKKNLITDVKGLYIGNSENELINTGSTILTCEDRFVASYKVLGGAPGTRETDLLEPDKLIEKIDALVFYDSSENIKEILIFCEKIIKDIQLVTIKSPLSQAQ